MSEQKFVKKNRSTQNIREAVGAGGPKAGVFMGLFVWIAALVAVAPEPVEAVQELSACTAPLQRHLNGETQSWAAQACWLLPLSQRRQLPRCVAEVQAKERAMDRVGTPPTPQSVAMDHCLIQLQADYKTCRETHPVATCLDQVKPLEHSPKLPDIPEFPQQFIYKYSGQLLVPGGEHLRDNRMQLGGVPLPQTLEVEIWGDGRSIWRREFKSVKALSSAVVDFSHPRRFSRLRVQLVRHQLLIETDRDQREYKLSADQYRSAPTASVSAETKVLIGLRMALQAESDPRQMETFERLRRNVLDARDAVAAARGGFGCRQSADCRVIAYGPRPCGNFQRHLLYSRTQAGAQLVRRVEGL